MNGAPPPLGALSPERFLERYWQRDSVVLGAALVDAVDLVDGDVLAGLACEIEVESRLVLRDRETDTWRCEDGPFDEARFAGLPPGDWTLLVQAVDQWLPEAALLLSRFDFLPRWRVDDAMFSYAAPGGGVGPHFDYYDVFLIQIAGSRRWRLGARCDEHTALREHPTMKLIASFEPLGEHVLEPGDMLYLPAGLAHDGEAIGDGCITCSVGFRAPSHRELLQVAAEGLASSLPEHRRYRDPPGSPRADRHRIDDRALAALADLWRRLDPAAAEQALATAFGHLVTLSRHPELVEPADGEAMRRVGALVEQGAPLSVTHHPASRLAYRLREVDAELYVDGDAHVVSAAFARGLCDGRLDAAALGAGSDRALLLELASRGVVGVEDWPGATARRRR